MLPGRLTSTCFAAKECSCHGRSRGEEGECFNGEKQKKDVIEGGAKQSQDGKVLRTAARHAAATPRFTTGRPCAEAG
jgi:hypothetical protein